MINGKKTFGTTNVLRAITLCTLGLVLPWSTGCQDPSPSPVYELSRPRSLALACREAGAGGVAKGLPLSQCISGEQGRLVALVPSTSVGEVAALDMPSRKFINTERTIPGITHIPVGKVPNAIAVTPDGQWAITANTGSGDLSLLHVGNLCQVGRIATPGRPNGLTITPDGLLAITLQDTKAIAWTRLQDCDFDGLECVDVNNLTLPTISCPMTATVELPGYPTAVVADSERGLLYLSLGDQDRVAIVDLDRELVVGLVATVPACNPYDAVSSQIGCVPESESEEDWIPSPRLPPDEENPLPWLPSGNRDEQPDDSDNDSDNEIDIDDDDIGENGENDVSQGLSAGAAGLALTPDGRFLYVLSRSRRAVMVFDTERRQLVNTGMTVPLSTEPGLAMNAVPEAIAFACFEQENPEELDSPYLPQECTPQSPLVLAVVGMITGEVEVIEAIRYGVGIHKPWDMEPDQGPQVERPHLIVGGREVPFENQPPKEYPSFTHDPSLFSEEGGYGITLISDMAEELDGLGIPLGASSIPGRQSWSVVWEGIVPGAEGTSGLLLPTPLACTGAEDPLFYASGGTFLRDCRKNFCASGVEPGDSIIILPAMVNEPRSDMCEETYPATGPLKREGFEYCVAEVAPHHLRLVAVKAQEIQVEGDDHQAAQTVRHAAPGRTDNIPCVEAEVDGEELDLLPSGVERDCFPQPLPYRIRAKEQFLVYRHSLPTNQTGEGGLCTVRPDASPLRQGRTTLGADFLNTSLNFVMESPKEERELPIPRGLTWRIPVAGNITPLRLSLGLFVSAMTFNPASGEVLVADGGLDTLYTVNPITGIYLPAIDHF